MITIVSHCIVCLFAVIRSFLNHVDHTEDQYAKAMDIIANYEIIRMHVYFIIENRVSVNINSNTFAGLDRPTTLYYCMVFSYNWFQIPHILSCLISFRGNITHISSLQKRDAPPPLSPLNPLTCFRGPFTC